MECNEDCLNCPYEDCIKTDGTKASKKYYETHREVILAKRREYYRQNAEEIKARQRARREAGKC